MKKMISKINPFGQEVREFVEVKESVMTLDQLLKRNDNTVVAVKNNELSKHLFDIHSDSKYLIYNLSIGMNSRHFADSLVNENLVEEIITLQKGLYCIETGWVADDGSHISYEIESVFFNSLKDAEKAFADVEIEKNDYKAIELWIDGELEETIKFEYTSEAKEIIVRANYINE